MAEGWRLPEGRTQVLRCACGHGLSRHVPRRIGNPPSGYTYTTCSRCACGQFVNEYGQRFEQGELTAA